VSAQPAEKAPGIPKWVPRVLPAWWPLAAAAAAVLIIGVVLLARGGKKKAAPPPRPAPVAAAPAPAPIAVPPPAPEKTEAKPPPPPKIAQANPNAKNFDRAQKAIWTGQSAIAESALHELLAKKNLPKKDRARATRMMGDMFARKGDKPHASEWYRKSLPLVEPAERIQVIKLIQSVR